MHVINLVLPINDPLATRAAVDPSDLEGKNFLFFPRSSSPHYYDRIMSWCRDVGLHPSVSRETESWIAVLSMIGAGLGMSLGTELLGRIHFPGVAYRKIDAEPLDVSFWMSWAPARISPSAERLIRHFQENVAQE